MKQAVVCGLGLMACLVALAGLAGCSDGPAGEPVATLVYQGPSVSPAVTYAAWVEDSQGNNLQNLYVCQRVADGSLTGDPLPVWTTLKRPQRSDIDGVAGASQQGGLEVVRTLELGGVRQFRICFEIDRSLNDNQYFGDRPAFTYRSGLIDLDNLQASYSLALEGWMSNNTLSGPYSQAPLAGSAIPGWAAFAWMTDLAWVADAGGSTWNDMVSSLTVTVRR